MEPPDHPQPTARLGSPPTELIDKYRALITHMPLGFGIIELNVNEVGQPIDYRFLEVNPAFEQLTGFVDAVDKTILELRPNPEQGWFEQYNQVLKTGQPLHVEQVAARAAGDVWYDVFAFPIGPAQSNQVAFFFDDITGRKRTQAALQRSEERFRRFVMANSDVVYTMSADWQQMNQLRGKTFLVDTGQPSRDWLLKYILPEDQERVETAIAEAIATKRVFEMEHRVLRTDGQIGWTYSRAVPILDEQGHLLEWVGVASDITQRKQEEQHQAYLLTLANTLRPIEDPVIIEETIAQMTMQQLGADRCYYCRIEAGQAIIVRDAVRGDLPSVAGTYSLSSFALLKQAIDAGRPFVVDDVTTSLILDEDVRAMCLRLGIISFLNVPIIKQNQAVGLLCTVQSKPRRWTQAEINLAIKTAERTWAAVERAKAEEARREADGRLRLATEAVGLATWEWHLETDQVYWNEQHFRLLGMVPQRGPLPSDVFVRHLYFEDRTYITDLLTKAIQEQSLYDADFRIVREDGVLRWMRGYGRVIEQYQSHSVRMSGVMVDITDRKVAEEGMREADRRKDEFLAMLAHELRNPLAPIRMGLQLMTQTYTEDPTLGVMLPMMNRQMVHLVRLVDDLLDASRISRGQIELRKDRLDLVQVVSQALDAMRPQYSSVGRQLTAQLPDYSLALAGDATRLNQVVINLLTNSLRYTNEGGQVWLSLTQVGEQAVLRVSDDGIGLAADQLEAIFGLFAQVDTSLARSRGGLGVGLALIRQLVERHGGRVEAHSAGLGQGSEFVVYLPLSTT